MTSSRRFDCLIRGMGRVEFLDLANRHQIPTIQTTADELEEELASLEP